MLELSRKEILENRKKWANYLIEKRLYKEKGRLQKYKGTSCCCLGHACNVFKIPKKTMCYEYLFGENKEKSFAPTEIVELIRLYDVTGVLFSGNCLFFDEKTRKIYKKQNKKENRKRFRSLVDLNDFTSATPKEIGRFIKAHINDGLIFEKV